MSNRRNFRSNNNNNYSSGNNYHSKPIYKYKEEDFPDLVNDVSGSKLDSVAVWPLTKTGIPPNARVFDNGDVFDGDYDETGQPAYGTLRFSNGNIYRGPIHYAWPKEYDEDEDKEDWEWEEEEQWANPYGELRFPDGRRFRGVFCFGKM